MFDALRVQNLHQVNINPTAKYRTHDILYIKGLGRILN